MLSLGMKMMKCNGYIMAAQCMMMMKKKNEKGERDG